MRSAWLIFLGALSVSASAVPNSNSAYAGGPVFTGGPPYPAVPPEIGVARFIGPVWDTYRCAVGPVYNFYDGAYYGEEPPALYRGYAYRPYYRYSAYRRWPRTYYCVTE